ncbi:hypothetical protein CKAN_02364800 [Cinnamomum micranthum f. kanehirae]|uniref:DUF1618 domain-containing protein n=1 Tax=Cinnamomum micranthum f. kanehirae TaxID=337451 RepID=A0A443PUB5_9MAGN|nr:hypothetical protein CKAN_02364800 [Cinnamomum micranthum f. kanehirae]
MCERRGREVCTVKIRIRIQMARKECYLYVQTIPLLLRLNLSDLFESGSSAEFEVAHNYRTSDGRVPIGMACIVVGSKIYMVGGEKAQKGSTLYEPDEENWLNSDVYFFDHTKPESEDRLVPVRDGDSAVVGRLNGPKTLPMGFTLEGKFYVLSTRPFLGSLPELIPPVFEVFDPTLPIPSWKILPYQPKSAVMDYFAWGHKVLTFPGLLIFNAKDEKWENGAAISKQFTYGRTPFPMGATVEFKGVVFAVSMYVNCLVAYVLDASGILNAHWVLDELSEVFEGRPIHIPCQGFLTDLGGGRMCFLFSWEDDGRNWNIRVQVFQVSITTVGDRPGRPVVHREIMRSFDLRSWNHYNVMMIESVFLCDHSNESDIEADASSGSYSCVELKKRAGHAIEYVEGDSKKPKTTLPE